MQNAILVGLSRQVALAAKWTWSPTISRTSTPPATRPTVRCSRNISPRPRAPAMTGSRVSFVLRPRHLARHEPGRRSSTPAIRSTSPSTATASWSCRRRTASATPATARCRSTPPASSSPATAIRCSATAARSRLQPNDQQVSISRDGTISVREGTSNVNSARGKLRLVDLRQSAAAAEGRQQHLQADRRRAAATGGATPASSQGSIEKSNVRGVVEMSRMIEITRSLHPDRQPAAAAERSQPVGDRQARRSSGLTMKES